MSVIDLSADRYHADQVADRPTLSASIAHILCTSSPKHAWTAHPKLNPAYRRDEQEHFDIGTVAHAMLLEGDASCVEVLDFDDWRKQAAQDAREVVRASGRIPLLAKHWDAVAAMVAAARDQLAALDVAPPLFTDGKPEQTLVWEERGVACRARLDWLRDDRAAVDDYKTTGRTADPAAFSRAMFDRGYDLQAAFYLRGLHAVTGADAEFRFCVQETQPPYALSVVAPSPAAYALANDKIEYALAAWKRGLDTGEWPAYPVKVCYADVPTWHEVAWLDKEAREAA